MTRDELLSDLNYARTLAEEGRNAPLISGSYFLFFGALLAVCYAAQWAVLEGLAPIPASQVGIIWVAFGVVATIGSYLLGRRVRTLPGGAAIPNRIDRYIWHAILFALLAVVIATLIRTIVLGDLTAPNAIMAAGFGLYGVAIYAGATVGGHSWLKAFAFLSWAASGALWFFLDENWAYLIAATASVVVLIVPGLVMIKHEPKAVV